MSATENDLVEDIGDEREEVGFDQQPDSLFGVKKTYIWIGAGSLLTLSVAISLLSLGGGGPDPEPQLQTREAPSRSGVVVGSEGGSEAYMAQVEAYNESVYTGERSGHPILTVEESVEVPSYTEVESTVGLIPIDGVSGQSLMAGYTNNTQQTTPPVSSSLDMAGSSTGGYSANHNGTDPVFEDLVAVMERVNYTPSLTLIPGSRAALESMEGHGAEFQNTPLNNGGSVDENASSVSAAKIAFDATTLLYAVSNIALNSDYEGPVWLEVVGGFDKYPELDGASLTGRAVNLGEKMRLELDTLKLTDGSSYRVEAIALDLDTTYAAVASSVDHHTLYRYGWWGVGVALGAAGKGAQYASTQVAVQDGVIVQSTETSGRQEALIAAGELGRELSQEFRRRLDRPPTVHVNVGETIGVFFMKDVMDSGD